jgi:hypothetical protein
VNCLGSASAVNVQGLSQESSDNLPVSPPSNARREERFSVADKQVLMMRWGGGTSFESRRVRLVDCSAHGMGIEDDQPMQPGEQFVVYLRLKDITMVLYTVRYCRGSNERFKIGAELAGFIGTPKTSPDEVITSLLEQQLVS